MKTVMFKGIQIDIPDWATWVAVDFDGTTFAYEGKPEKDYYLGGYRRYPGQRCEHITIPEPEDENCQPVSKLYSPGGIG
jgi:hypothetical protein